MLEQPTQEIELTADQRRNLGHVYRMILGWRKNRENKPVSPAVSESLPEEYQSPQTESDSADQTESEA